MKTSKNRQEPAAGISVGAAIDAYFSRMASVYAPTTISSRRTVLRFFERFCASYGIADIRAFRRETADLYALYLREYQKEDGANLSFRTQSENMICVRVLFSDLAREGIVLINPAAHLKPYTKSIRSARETLTALEAERILAGCDTETPAGLRDRAILEILYAAGLRVSEAAALRISDVHVDTASVFVREGKGRRDRVVPCGTRAAAWVKRYTQEARPLLLAHPHARPQRARGPGKRGHDCEFLFLNKVGRRLRPKTLSTIAGDCVRKIKRPGAGHLFRHTAATLMLEGGADIRSIQEMLGHASVETTQIYTHVSAKHLRETFNRTHPSAFGESDESSSGPASQPAVRGRGSAMRIRSDKILPQRRNRSWPEPGAGRSDAERCLYEYIQYLGGTKNFSVSWRRSQLSRLTIFNKYLNSKKIEKVSEITRPLIQEYAAGLTERNPPMSVSSLRQSLMAVRSFCAYLLSRGLILIDPCAGLRLPRKPHTIPSEVLSHDEVERVMRVIDVSGPYGLRDRAIIETLYASSLRRGELVALDTGDLDRIRRTVHVRTSKNGEARVVPVSERACVWMDRYLAEIRPRLAASRLRDAGQNAEALFLGAHGERMKADLVSKIVKRYIELSGIGKKGCCHLFRHTSATLMYENGADIRQIQEILGHRKLSTTQIYTHVSVKHLREVHRKTHPAELRFIERGRMAELEQAAESEAHNAGEMA